MHQSMEGQEAGAPSYQPLTEEIEAQGTASSGHLGGALLPLTGGLQNVTGRKEDHIKRKRRSIRWFQL